VLGADDPDEFVVQKDAEGSCLALDRQRVVRFKMGSEKGKRDCKCDSKT
jgi:hypothetical protein